MILIYAVIIIISFLFLGMAGCFISEKGFDLIDTIEKEDNGCVKVLYSLVGFFLWILGGVLALQFWLIPLYIWVILFKSS